MNNVNPGVSILIPLYNGINFLEECLNSVKKQSYTNWEIIIGINGHKKDSTTSNLARSIVGSNSDKIKVINYSTIGKPNTLNEMVKDTKFDIICLLDVDDYWHPNKLQEQINIKCYYSVVGTQCYYVRGKTVTKQQPKIPIGYITEFFKVNPIINSSVMISKCDAWWDNIFGIEDYDCWFRLHSKGRSFYNIDKPLTYHRIHSESSFNGKNNIGVKALREKWSRLKNEK